MGEVNAEGKLEEAKGLIRRFLVAHRIVDVDYDVLDQVDEDMKAFMGLTEDQLTDIIRKEAYAYYRA